MHDRLTNAKVAPDSGAVVEADIVHHIGIALDDPETAVALEGLGVVGFGEGELDLSRPESRDGRRRIGEIAVDQAIRLRLSAPIAIIGSQFDILIADMLHELERTGSDWLGGPPRALGDLLDVHGRQRMLRQHHQLRQNGEECRVRLAELDDCRARIRRLDRCNIGKPCGKNAAALGILGKLEGELDVGRGKRRAVMPVRLGELERVCQVVLAEDELRSQRAGKLR